MINHSGTIFGKQQFVPDIDGENSSQATEGKSFAKLCSYYAEHSRWIRCLLKVSSENDRDERKDVTTLTKFIFAPFVHLSGT
jgi:hypothetical protein